MYAYSSLIVSRGGGCASIDLKVKVNTYRRGILQTSKTGAERGPPGRLLHGSAPSAVPLTRWAFTRRKACPDQPMFAFTPFHCKLRRFWTIRWLRSGDWGTRPRRGPATFMHARGRRPTGPGLQCSQEQAADSCMLVRPPPACRTHPSGTKPGTSFKTQVALHNTAR